VIPRAQSHSGTPSNARIAQIIVALLDGSSDRPQRRSRRSSRRS
jgi:hypothetical protein